MAQPAVRRTTNFVRANKDIIGTKVVNPQNEDLGKIEDLIVDSSGRISYAVLSFGGFLGLGDKDFAIPFNAFAFDAANTVGGCEREIPGGLIGATREQGASQIRKLKRLAAERGYQLIPGHDPVAWPALTASLAG